MSTDTPSDTTTDGAPSADEQGSAAPEKPAARRAATAAKKETAPEPRRKPGPPESVDDEDVDLLARILTDAQIDKIVAVRRGKADEDTWRRLGIIPGKHLIPTTNIRCMVANGKLKGLLKKGEKVEISFLDQETHDILRKQGLLVPPGTPEGVKALADIQ
jgi:hypothetical protein